MAVAATAALKRAGNRDVIESKQLRDSMVKFGDALQGLQSNVKKQTVILSQMLDSQMEDRIRREREDDLKRVTEDEQRKRNERNNQREKDDKSGMVDWKVAALSMLGGIKGIGAMLATGAIALAPAVAETIKNLLSVGLEYIGFSPEFSQKFGESMGSAVGWGSLGLLLGKKMGMTFAAGSLLWDYVGKTLNLDDKIQQLGESIGLELSPMLVNGIGAVGSTALIFIGTKLTRKALGKAFDMVMTEGLISKVADSVSGPLSTAARATFRSGFSLAARALPLGAAAAIGGLYYAYGDEAAAWISEQTGVPVAWSDMAVTTTSFAAAGASLGAMFGPGGAVVGGIVGLIAGLGYSVWKWYKNKQEKAREEAAKEIAATDKAIAALDTTKNTTGKIDTLEVGARASAVVNDTNTYTGGKDTAAKHTSHDLLRQVMDLDMASDNSIRIVAQNIRQNMRSLMSSYDGSEEQRNEVDKAMHAMMVLRQSLNESRGKVKSDAFSLLDTNAKATSRELYRFFEENGLTDAMIAIHGENGKLPKFKSGTIGFQDFGPETPALLHDREAVIPENTEAADYLKRFFNADWSMQNRFKPPAAPSGTKFDVIEKQSTTRNNSNIVFAPTNNNPVVTIHRGNRVSSSNFTNIGGASSDLDYGLPRGAL